MKKTLQLSLTVLLFGTLFLASCSKQEDPSSTTPANTNPRTRFNGNWVINEKTSDLGTVPPYNVTITDSSDATHILFAYLYGYNKKTYATVSGNNFTIPTQLIQGNNISGNGVLTSVHRIDMKYLVQTTGTHYDTVTAVLTK